VSIVGTAPASIERARAIVAGQPHLFRPEFPEWFASNEALWQRFEATASAIYRSGRPHYSARTIWHNLRDDTGAREQPPAEQPEGEFKLNNNVSPDLARLWLAVYPERAGFFELRESPARKVM
jgi:hypothetical protein